jgi:Cu-processing system permease protein
MAIGFDRHVTLVMARKEFRDRVRNKWVIAVAAIFTVFALVIAYFGMAQGGAIGFKGMDVTIASLVSLVVFLVPLIALMLGYDAVVGERERGSLDLLLSQPITRLELLIGKWLGLAAALAISSIVGFGLVGIILSYGIGVAALIRYAYFVISTLALGFAFLSIAVLISVQAANRVTASGMAIALWFFFILIYDLILLGIMVVSSGTAYASAFPTLLLLNPTDVFRILNVFATGEMQSMYGLATAVPGMLADKAILVSIMLVWIVLPMMLAYHMFRNPGRN